MNYSYDDILNKCNKNINNLDNIRNTFFKLNIQKNINPENKIIKDNKKNETNLSNSCKNNHNTIFANKNKCDVDVLSENISSSSNLTLLRSNNFKNVINNREEKAKNSESKYNIFFINENKLKIKNNSLMKENLIKDSTKLNNSFDGVNKIKFIQNLKRNRHNNCNEKNEDRIDNLEHKKYFNNHINNLKLKYIYNHKFGNDYIQKYFLNKNRKNVRILKNYSTSYDNLNCSNIYQTQVLKKNEELNSVSHKCDEIKKKKNSIFEKINNAYTTLHPTISSNNNYLLMHFDHMSMSNSEIVKKINSHDLNKNTKILHHKYTQSSNESFLDIPSNSNSCKNNNISLIKKDELISEINKEKEHLNILNYSNEYIQVTKNKENNSEMLEKTNGEEHFIDNIKNNSNDNYMNSINDFKKEKRYLGNMEKFNDYRKNGSAKNVNVDIKNYNLNSNDFNHNKNIFIYNNSLKNMYFKKKVDKIKTKLKIYENLLDFEKEFKTKNNIQKIMKKYENSNIKVEHENSEKKVLYLNKNIKCVKYAHNVNKKNSTEQLVLLNEINTLNENEEIKKDVNLKRFPINFKLKDYFKNDKNRNNNLSKKNYINSLLIDNYEKNSQMDELNNCKRNFNKIEVNYKKEFSFCFLENNSDNKKNMYIEDLFNLNDDINSNIETLSNYSSKFTQENKILCKNNQIEDNKKNIVQLKNDIYEHKGNENKNIYEESIKNMEYKYIDNKKGIHGETESHITKNTIQEIQPEKNGMHNENKQYNGNYIEKYCTYKKKNHRNEEHKNIETEEENSRIKELYENESYEENEKNKKNNEKNAKYNYIKEIIQEEKKLKEFKEIKNEMCKNCDKTTITEQYLSNYHFDFHDISLSNINLELNFKKIAEKNGSKIIEVNELNKIPKNKGSENIHSMVCHKNDIRNIKEKKFKMQINQNQEKTSILEYYDKNLNVAIKNEKHYINDNSNINEKGEEAEKIENVGIKNESIKNIYFNVKTCASKNNPKKIEIESKINNENINIEHEYYDAETISNEINEISCKNLISENFNNEAEYFNDKIKSVNAKNEIDNDNNGVECFTDQVKNENDKNKGDNEKGNNEIESFNDELNGNNIKDDVSNENINENDNKKIEYFNSETKRENEDIRSNNNNYENYINNESVIKIESLKCENMYNLCGIDNEKITENKDGKKENKYNESTINNEKRKIEINKNESKIDLSEEIENIINRNNKDNRENENIKSGNKNIENENKDKEYRNISCRNANKSEYNNNEYENEYNNSEYSNQNNNNDYENTSDCTYKNEKIINNYKKESKNGNKNIVIDNNYHEGKNEKDDSENTKYKTENKESENSNNEGEYKVIYNENDDSNKNIYEKNMNEMKNFNRNNKEEIDNMESSTIINHSENIHLGSKHIKEKTSIFNENIGDDDLKKNNGKDENLETLDILIKEKVESHQIPEYSYVENSTKEKADEVFRNESLSKHSEFQVHPRTIKNEANQDNNIISYIEMNKTSNNEIIKEFNNLCIKINKYNLFKYLNIKEERLNYISFLYDSFDYFNKTLNVENKKDTLNNDKCKKYFENKLINIFNSNLTENEDYNTYNNIENFEDKSLNEDKNGLGNSSHRNNEKLSDLIDNNSKNNEYKESFNIVEDIKKHLIHNNINTLSRKESNDETEAEFLYFSDENDEDNILYEDIKRNAWLQNQEFHNNIEIEKKNLVHYIKLESVKCIILFCYLHNIKYFQGMQDMIISLFYLNLETYEIFCVFEKILHYYAPYLYLGNDFKNKYSLMNVNINNSTNNCKMEDISMQICKFNGKIFRLLFQFFFPHISYYFDTTINENWPTFFFVNLNFSKFNNVYCLLYIWMKLIEIRGYKNVFTCDFVLYLLSFFIYKLRIIKQIFYQKEKYFNVNKNSNFISNGQFKKDTIEEKDEQTVKKKIHVNNDEEKIEKKKEKEHQENENKEEKEDVENQQLKENMKKKKLSMYCKNMFSLIFEYNSSFDEHLNDDYKNHIDEITKNINGIKELIPTSTIDFIINYNSIYQKKEQLLNQDGYIDKKLSNNLIKQLDNNICLNIKISDLFFIYNNKKHYEYVFIRLLKEKIILSKLNFINISNIEIENFIELKNVDEFLNYRTKLVNIFKNNKKIMYIIIYMNEKDTLDDNEINPHFNNICTNNNEFSDNDKNKNKNKYINKFFFKRNIKGNNIICDKIKDSRVDKKCLQNFVIILLKNNIKYLTILNENNNAIKIINENKYVEEEISRTKSLNENGFFFQMIKKMKNKIYGNNLKEDEANKNTSLEKIRLQNNNFKFILNDSNLEIFNDKNIRKKVSYKKKKLIQDNKNNTRKKKNEKSRNKINNKMEKVLHNKLEKKLNNNITFSSNTYKESQKHNFPNVLKENANETNINFNKKECISMMNNNLNLKNNLIFKKNKKQKLNSNIKVHNLMYSRLKKKKERIEKVKEKQKQKLKEKDNKMIENLNKKGTKETKNKLYSNITYLHNKLNSQKKENIVDLSKENSNKDLHINLISKVEINKFFKKKGKKTLNNENKLSFLEFQEKYFNDLLSEKLLHNKNKQDCKEIFANNKSNRNIIN